MVLDVCPRLPSPRRGDPPGRRADRWPGRPGPAAPTDRTDQACSGSSRAESTRDLRAEQRGADRRARLRRLRHRWPVGRRAPRRRCCRPWPPPSPSCRPTGPATSWASATRCRWSRPWRSGSTCSTACCRPAWPATARPSPAPAGSSSGRRATGDRRLAPRRRLRVPGVRALQPGLPAPPAHGRRADRRPAAHHPQPELDAGPDGATSEARSATVRSSLLPSAAGR